MSILVDAKDGVCTITFNRPEKKNAFTVAMYEQLVAAIAKAEADDHVRAMLFTGAGDAFTGGNDLGDFMNQPPTGEDTPVFRLLMMLVDVEKPIVTAVNGAAVGIGTTMLLHTDINLASDKARFQMPFINLALVPEAGSTLLLPRLAGHPRAAELLMLGEPFDAITARDVGLITRVVEAASLRGVAEETARKLAEKPRLALRRTKRLLKDPLRDELKMAIRHEAEQFLRSLGSPEAMEAFSAFFEKRKPDFTKIRDA
jgi:enoyl-CoA hydratase/carnithine racemase